MLLSHNHSRYYLRALLLLMNTAGISNPNFYELYEEIGQGRIKNFGKRIDRLQLPDATSKSSYVTQLGPVLEFRTQTISPTYMNQLVSAPWDNSLSYKLAYYIRLLMA